MNTPLNPGCVRQLIAHNRMIRGEKRPERYAIAVFFVHPIVYEFEQRLFVKLLIGLSAKVVDKEIICLFCLLNDVLRVDPIILAESGQKLSEVYELYKILIIQGFHAAITNHLQSKGFAKDSFSFASLTRQIEAPI